MTDSQPPIAGLIHTYAYRKIAFEYAAAGSKNVLIFVGGLMDGIMTVPYLPALAAALSRINYSLIQIQISSSHIGWGTGSLARDSEEIAQLVHYLKSETGGSREVIGFMGHSTGCQNTLHYFTKHSHSDVKKETKAFVPLDFGILQAPVSDRFTIASNMSREEIDESIALATQMIKDKRHKELMPKKYSDKFFGVPINAYRWNSLVGVRGDDDFFSPDLLKSDFDESFGKFNKPLLVLYSGSDEFVDKSVDVKELMGKWKTSVGDNWSPNSKIVEGAVHNIGYGSAPGAEKDAVETVIKFIQSL